MIMTTTTKAKSKPRAKKAKKNVYDIITKQIIKAMENGVGGWQRGWTIGAENGINGLSPANATTGKTYTGINRLILSLTMHEMGYKENFWVTYKQAEAEGWQVAKGQKGTMLTFYGSAEKDPQANKAQDEKEYYRFINAFTVFNVGQLEGYEAKATITPKPTTAENNEILKRIIANTDVTILPEGGNEAFYIPSADAIQMPPRAAFTSQSAYGGTLAHEFIHSTKKPERCDRDYKSQYDSKEAYAREELVAELGAAFLCSEMNCISETLENHACYINSWIQLLKKDDQAIFKACAAAQKATDFIMYEWAVDKKQAPEAVAV